MEVNNSNNYSNYKLYSIYFDMFLNGLSGCLNSVKESKIAEDKVKLYTLVKNSVDMKIGIIDYFMGLFEKQYKKSLKNAADEELETEKKLIIDLNSCTDFISQINYPKLTARYDAITGVYKERIDCYFDFLVNGLNLKLDEDMINYKESLYEKAINDTSYDYVRDIEKFLMNQVRGLYRAKRLSKSRIARISIFVNYLDNPRLTFQFNKIFNKSQIFDAKIEIEISKLKKTLN